jgi:hypothetical protein
MESMTMPKYLTQNPAHTQFLDMLQTQSVGWRVEFWKFKDKETDPFIAASANRVKFAVKDAISRISRLADDEGKTEPMKHEASRQIYENLAKHVAKDVKEIRDWSDRESLAARDRAVAVLAPEGGKEGIYAEIRAYCASRRADPAFPAELTKLNRENIDVARALGAGPGFLSGLSDERHKSLWFDAMLQYAPEDTAAMTHAVDVGRGVDQIETGMRKLRQAAFVEPLSDRVRASYVDPNAPLAAPPEA